MPGTNYQLMLDNEIKLISKGSEKPSLLLHICCAPCSSYVLEYLSEFFRITLFFYNPNITSADEYNYRIDEAKRLISEMPLPGKVDFIAGRYDISEFFAIAKDFENEPEGSERCFRCYELRLRETAEFAKKNGFDYFTTTLSISPYKNAEKLNSIGSFLADEYGVKYLFSDFKKKNGYKRSIELSAIYNLYRQNFCGCVYSEMEMKRRKTNESNDI
ncbi:MAG: epoxyqueuosine reductase QueH [Clostridia bacterium]|nr:epoxyqueuosine reductase QueH [Clostridia bacterium]